MTREEAIKYLKEMKDECNDTFHMVRYVTQEEALEMAIQALEQEPSGDLISRQTVLDVIRRISLGQTDAVKVSMMTEDYVKKLPFVKQEPKTGHWIAIDEEPHEVWECDHCGFVIDGSGCIEPYEYRDIYKYCPNCGAKMVEQESEG